MSELIRFENLFKTFGQLPVYEGLNLQIFKGETLSVLGGSGTGKSVLLKTLIGLLRPDAGRVWFEGQDVTGWTEKEWLPIRRRVAMVFQGAALFDSMSVFDNVAYPLRRAFPAMNAAQLYDTVEERLSWVNLNVKRVGPLRPSELSGGMAKRVGLARALAVTPEVILWDEPTSGLDPISRRIINTLILSMNARLAVTSIVVTHDLASAYAVSNRLALLSNRRIVEVGTVEDMRNSKHPEVSQFLDDRAWEG